MNLTKKTAILEIANERRTGISAQKGPEYAGSADKYDQDDQDVLANFKRQGDRWGVSPLLPTGVYFGKHIDSIETFIREVTRDGTLLGEQQLLARKGEGIVSRLDDARNYLDLLECLLVDLDIVADPTKGDATGIAEADIELATKWVQQDWSDDPAKPHIGIFDSTDMRVVLASDFPELD